MKRELHVITTGTHSLHDLKERLVQIHPYVDFIHIREKERSAKEVAELILQLVQSGVPKKKIVVNDRVDVAFALEVAGVQLAYHSLNPAIVRRSFPSLRIGRSVHSLDEAIQAEKEGADYCIYGHIFETSSKEGRTPKGVEELKLLSSRLTIPVIAIGIPTVVDAVSMASDTIDFILKHFGKEMREGDSPSRSLAPAGMTFGERRKLTEEDLPGEEHRKNFLGIVGTLPEEEKRKLIHEVLSPLGHNLMVTPKEVDDFIEDMANVVAEGLNSALHFHVNQDNVDAYTH